MSTEPPKPDPIAVPEKVKNAATLGSFFSNVVAPVTGLILSALFGIQANWLIGGLFLLLVLLVIVFKYLTNSVSQSTQDAVDKVLASGIPTTDARKEVADHLKKLERRYRYALYFGIGVTLAVAVAFITHWSVRYFNTRLPREVAFEKAERFHPSAHKETVLAKAPFLEAILGDLEAEGKADGRPFQIVLLTTAPLGHPTPPFQLTVFYEQGSADIAGYAFRRQPGGKGNQIEPIPMTYGSADKLGLAVPACETGDQLFIVARLSLKQAKEFPDNLAERTKTKVDPAKEKQ